MNTHFSLKHVCMKNKMPARRVRAVLSDYAEGSKKRNQSGTDYVLDVDLF